MSLNSHQETKSNQILEALRSHYTRDLNYFKVFKNDKGTRFTGTGFDLAKGLWNVYIVKLPPNYIVLNKTLLMLDSRMTWPYYLSKKMLVLFNEMDAFEFTLYQGDINLWSNKS
jgi:hypothetical protein